MAPAAAPVQRRLSRVERERCATSHLEQPESLITSNDGIL